MAKTNKGKHRRSNRVLDSINAVNRREENAAKHAAMMAKHVARKTAIAQYEIAHNEWCDRRDEQEKPGRSHIIVGPPPLDPRFHDRDLFPENFTPIV